MSLFFARAEDRAASASLPFLACSQALALAAALAGCGPSAPHDDGDAPPPERQLDSTGRASVDVDLAAEGASVGPHAFGLHASVYDNALHDPALPGLLADSGVTLLRWPGGGYSDNYHWSTHSMTPWVQDDGDLQYGYLAENSDFGSFVRLLESTGTSAMITVNYGSNLGGTGPGEPKEAAAWVAYANGDPADTTPIGVDSVGNDWRTVGHWASLRAAEPLAVDDGQNFLRVARAEPLGIAYWEIGNEVFGNGYYAGEFELDLHVPYDGTDRLGHPELSGSSYGRGVSEFALAMRAVDPSIKIGAVLNTPPVDLLWGPTWNADVLAECARDVDFGVVHWYVAGSSSDILRAPRQIVPVMVRQLRELFAAHAGDHAPNIELAMTELGPNFTGTGVNQIANYGSYDATQQQVAGMFAADAYASLIRNGFFNVDWLELHNGSFLSERNQRRGAAFHGIQLAHHFVEPGDTFVATVSSHAGSITAHAARRADGKLAVLLFNTSTRTTANVSVNVAASALAATGSRYDYAPARDDAGAITTSGAVTGPTALEGLGNPFDVELAPYSASVVVVDSATP